LSNTFSLRSSLNVSDQMTYIQSSQNVHIFANSVLAFCGS
jgi:hypothetical protein